MGAMGSMVDTPQTVTRRTLRGRRSLQCGCPRGHESQRNRIPQQGRGKGPTPALQTGRIRTLGVLWEPGRCNGLPLVWLRLNVSYRMPRRLSTQA